MTFVEFAGLPKSQRDGVVRVHRQQKPELPFDMFLERYCTPPSNERFPWVGVGLEHSYIGIEPDGYAHT